MDPRGRLSPTRGADCTPVGVGTKDDARHLPKALKTLRISSFVPTPTDRRASQHAPFLFVTSSHMALQRVRSQERCLLLAEPPDHHVVPVARSAGRDRAIEQRVA